MSMLRLPILLGTVIYAYAASQTDEIARKLALLEREIDHPPAVLDIPYDPFHPHAPRKHAASHAARHKITPKRHPKPVLSMILNKKAFINGKWVKENQKIADYIVSKISEDTVFLKRGRKIIALHLSKQDGILTTKEE